MKQKEWKEILKKCFGKEKDDRYHAIAMLAIYGVFILILVIFIRVGGSSTNQTTIKEPNQTSSPSTNSPTTNPIPENPTTNPSINDINYSYSYTITYNGVSEVYLGKKIDEKEKFTLIRNGITTNYAILNDNYLILEDGVYHITENPSKFFKYCDIEKILNLVENEIPTQNEERIKYTVSNQSLSSIYRDVLSLDNGQSNMIQLSLSDNILKGLDLDFSNYFTSIEGIAVSFLIHMEFADIGTTEDFEIPV